MNVITMINRKHLEKLRQSFLENLALTWICGVITLILGLLVVVEHNIWSRDWRIIITLIGWVTLAKGLFLLVFPLKMFQVGSRTFRTMSLIGPFVLFLLGTYLSYVVFFGQV